MPDVDLQIVVPSRGRPDSIPRVSALVPSAIWCVEETEADDYAAAPRLLLHPPLANVGCVQNWCLDNLPNRCLMFVYDDFVCVHAMVGRHIRRIHEPDAIYRIVENSALICVDLGVSLFFYYATPNPLSFKASDPIAFVSGSSGGFGIVGRSRHARLEETLGGREDIDMCMRVLLHERILYQDRRFCFDYGAVFTKARGGYAGIRTAESEQRNLVELRRRWGPYLRADKKLKHSFGIHVAVQRRISQPGI